MDVPFLPPLAFTSSKGAGILHLETGQIELLKGSPELSAPYIAWHSSGRLAVGFRNSVNKLIIWDPEGRIIATFDNPHELTTRFIAWNSAGTRLATTGAVDTFVRVWAYVGAQMGSALPLGASMEFEFGTLGPVTKTFIASLPNRKL